MILTEDAASSWNVQQGGGSWCSHVHLAGKSCKAGWWNRHWHASKSLLRLRHKDVRLTFPGSPSQFLFIVLRTETEKSQIQENNFRKVSDVAVHRPDKARFGPTCALGCLIMVFFLDILPRPRLGTTTVDPSYSSIFCHGSTFD